MYFPDGVTLTKLLILLILLLLYDSYTISELAQYLWRGVSLLTIHSIKKVASILISAQRRRGRKLFLMGRDRCVSQGEHWKEVLGVKGYPFAPTEISGWSLIVIVSICVVSVAERLDHLFSLLGSRENLSVSQPISRERRLRSWGFWWLQEKVHGERAAEPEGWPQTRWSPRLVWTLMQEASCLSLGPEGF